MKRSYSLILMFLFFSNLVFSQVKTIKVINKKKIDYYYVYQIIDLSDKLNDTLIILGNRFNDNEFKRVRLKVNNVYKIETMGISRVRILKNEYLFVSPGETSINKIDISGNGKLPILILNYKMISHKE